MFSPSKFKALRVKCGFTQKSLGEAIGTSERRIRFWEAGEVEPSASFLLQIMLLFNCKPQDLMENPAK